MENHTEQIKRIKSKLLEAKEADKKLKVFGSSSHQYTINKPASKEDIEAFETKHAIQLPTCYKAFISTIGNGGVSYENSAAGPFYGIYPLGKNMDELIFENAEKHLKDNCILSPKMLETDWNSLTKLINCSDSISDEIYERELAKLYGGVLPIGSQGCTYLHAIVLNGSFKGRVVNLDLDRQVPQFAFEKNFLDWYERWLDEIISGELLEKKTSWFGYTKGGSEIELLEGAINSVNEDEKLDCLNGLLDKQFVSIKVIIQAESSYLQNLGVIKTKWLQLLCKHNYLKSKPYLLEYAQTDLLSVFQFIYWYAKEDSSNWLHLIEINITKIEDEKTFEFCCYLLNESNNSYGHLILSFTKHTNKNIQSRAYSALGQLKNKNNYIETFIEGLNSDYEPVILSILQALSNVKDERLLEAYKQLAIKYNEENEYSIFSYLNLRLKEYGLDNVMIQNKSTPLTLKTEIPPTSKKWYEIWK